MSAPTPLPAGATAEPQWTEEPGGLPTRLIFTARRPVAGTTVEVLGSAVQLGDGRLDPSEPRTVIVTKGDAGITTAQARALATQLLAVADELDSWVVSQ